MVGFNIPEREKELIREVAALRRRRDDLLEANNRYLERARKAEADVNVWVDEARTWAKAYADLRQKVDIYTMRLDIWIKGLKRFAFTGMFIDVILWLTALAVITGGIPPAIWGR